MRVLGSIFLNRKSVTHIKLFAVVCGPDTICPHLSCIRSQPETTTKPFLRTEVLL